MFQVRFNDGFTSYTLARARRGVRRAGALSPTRARAVLASAIRRREHQLVQQLAEHMHMHGADADDVVARALAMVDAGQLVLTSVRRERAAP